MPYSQSQRHVDVLSDIYSLPTIVKIDIFTKSFKQYYILVFEVVINVHKCDKCTNTCRPTLAPDSQAGDQRGNEESIWQDHIYF